MRRATCICGEGGTVNVQGPDYGQTFGRGAVVDLDAPVKAGVRQTWGEAIGKTYAHLFQVEDTPKPSKKAVVTREEAQE